MLANISKVEDLTLSQKSVTKTVQNGKLCKELAYFGGSVSTMMSWSVLTFHQYLSSVVKPIVYKCGNMMSA